MQRITRNPCPAAPAAAFQTDLAAHVHHVRRLQSDGEGGAQLRPGVREGIRTNGDLASHTVLAMPSLDMAV